MTTLVWLRDDLRTMDHEALTAACEESRTSGVVAVWIREDVASPAGPHTWLGGRPMGAATRWWYHRSLAHLHPRLAELGVDLVFATGDPRTIVPALADILGASVVRWSRRYAPAARELDSQVKQALAAVGIEAHSHLGALLAEPWEVSTAAGSHFTVFTPFHRAAQQVPVGAPLPVPPPVAQIPDHAGRITEATQEGLLHDLQGLRLLTGHPWWDDTVEHHWLPGEAHAQDHLERIGDWLAGYRTRHDLPAAPDSTSRLSPSLRSGEVSARMAFHAAHGPGLPAADAQAWVRQLYWREFSWHLTYHVPDLHRRPLRPTWEQFPYHPDDELIEAWRRGRTGIDLVDAGMLQLWHTGWMHNRVRMVTASLLAKNLLQPWWVGEQWFWDTLVDADEANNAVSWQWVAGCGADAAPYFRIFNPDRQQDRFDPDGTYVTHWLATRGDQLVPPVVDLAASRREALAAYDTLRANQAPPDR